eukprot:6490810-Amphidinium_carterae.1
MEVLKEAHASDNTIKALQDELLCEQQTRSLQSRRMEEMMSKVEDQARTHEQHSHQLEQRLLHVTAMHNTTMAEVQAELEALEESTPRFKKVETWSLVPQQCGSIRSRTAESICPNADRKFKFSSPRRFLQRLRTRSSATAAAAASPMPGLNFSKLSGAGSGGGSSCPQPGQTPAQGYESFGEPPNNSQNPTRPSRVQRPGGDFPNDHDDDDDNDQDDDGYGVNPRRRRRVIGWCDICQKNVFNNQDYRWCILCSKNLLHLKCLQDLGRPRAECLRCEDYKIKKPSASDGGGVPPDNDPDHYYGGEGGPNWPKRRDRESRERKPTREDVILKLASRLLPKLDVKNPQAQSEYGKSTSPGAY